MMIVRVPGVASLLSFSDLQNTAIIQHNCFSGFTCAALPYNTPAGKNAVIRLPSITLFNIIYKLLQT